jgi:hypothetical protein
MLMIQSIEIDLSVANLRNDIVDTQGADDLYYRFERTEGTGTVTAVVDLKSTINGQDSNLVAGTALVLDGTYGTVDVETFPFVVPVVTTAQAGNKGVLHIYTRRRPGIDGGGA